MAITYPAWTTGLHHDGSAVYVSNPYPTLNEKVTLTLRAPVDAPIRAVFVRSMPDGEMHLDPMQITDRNAVSAFWTTTFTVAMPLSHYRFKILTADTAYFYNALGISQANVPDYFDFKLVADFQAPAWVQDSVFYQIFPDRFHNGAPALTVKPGAWSKREHSVQVRDWDELPLPWSEAGSLDFFGGDLPGIIEKLDYLQELGVTGLYLTPIFPSKSNHRYNADDFFSIDPHLGGDAALADLRRALDARGMRLILDVTPNHVGSTHPWFTDAQQNPAAPTADFFTFYERPDDYLCWLGVKSLPKLNYGSQKLRDTMYRAEDSVLRHWMKPPYRIDGWRLDVLNMTARQGELQLSDEVGREMREAVKAQNPEVYLMGEHFFDPSAHLQGDQLDAVMNYIGFNIPVWNWLAGWDSEFWHETATDRNRLPSAAVAEQLALFRATIPWVLFTQQFHQLGSHDTPRFLTIVEGEKARQRLGLALLMTYPGVPCVYYGDEIGLEGGKDPDNRRTMPWDESKWDHELLAFYRQMIGLRKQSEALRRGSYEQIVAEGDVLAFQRETLEERVVVVAYRGTQALHDFSLPVAHAGILDGTDFTDVLSGQTFRVEGGLLAIGEVAAHRALVLQGIK